MERMVRYPTGPTGVGILIAGLAILGGGMAFPLASSRPWPSPRPSLPTHLPAPQGTIGSSEKGPPEPLAGYGELPLVFEPNQGQTDEEVRFLSRGQGYTLFLTPDEAVLALHQPAPRSALLADVAGGGRSAVVRLRLVGGDPAPRVMGEDELPSRSHYFIGQDPAGWRTDVPHYARVRYEQVYPGIDLVYYGNNGQLEYDFIVSPQVDPERVVMAFEGSDRLDLDGEGNLILHLGGRQVIQRAPLIYQEADGVRRTVSGGYALRGANRVGFRVAPYDVGHPLIIDPALAVYSTYLGGSTFDEGHGIAVGADGTAYVTGQTVSADFPTPGAVYYPDPAGLADVFVTRLSTAGDALLYTTFLGGTHLDFGLAVAVDSEGDAYVTGWTLSPNFPFTSFTLPFYAGSGPVQNAFVARLNPFGGLVYSKPLGFVQGRAIAVNAAGHAYVTGIAPSSALPATVNAFDTTHNGGNDAFVAQLSADGTTLIYATYLGGSGADEGNGIALDENGGAYVTGRTSSVDFPVTPGAVDVTSSGVDAFVAHLTPAGDALVAATYLGGAKSDWGTAIAVEAITQPISIIGVGGPPVSAISQVSIGASGPPVSAISLDAEGSGQTVPPPVAVWLTGYTQSSDFPTFPSPGAYDQTYNGYGDGFVASLNTALSGLGYGTYLGGQSWDSGHSIAVDGGGRAHVTGRTQSSDFPAVSGLDETLNGGVAAFVTKVNAAGTALIYSTYLGGNGMDGGNGIALDAVGDAYVTGGTNSPDFPISSNAPDAVLVSPFADAFVAKLHDSPAAAPAIAVAPSDLLFGDVALNASAAAALVVSNAGTAVLVVTSIDVGGAAAVEFSASPTSFAVDPGQSQTVQVTFAPTSEGDKSASLAIAHNAPGSPTVVPLNGTGILAEVDVTPPMLVYISVSPATVDVSGGPAPVTVTAGITDDLSGVMKWTMAFSSPAGILLIQGTPGLVAGTALAGVFQATSELPQLSQAGTWSATFLTLQDNAGNNSTVNLPLAGFDLSFSVTSSPPVPASIVVQVLDTGGTPGQTAYVPIQLVAPEGNVNALGFTLVFDPTVLNSPEATLGSGAGGATLVANANQAPDGHFGVLLALPAGQTFPPGAAAVVVVSLAIAAEIPADLVESPVLFGSQPVVQQVVDAGATPLPADWQPGTVAFWIGLEADVAPPPGGDGAVTAADVTLVGLFAAGLQAPENASQYMSADSAPLPCGEGLLTVADWVQAGVYATGLNPLTPACGPTGPPSGKPAVLAAGLQESGGRLVYLVDATVEAGASVSLAVELEALGDENALGFSLAYDGERLRFERVVAAEGAREAALHVNATRAGQLGILLALPAGQTFGAGHQALVEIQFAAVADGLPLGSPIGFSDQPVVREVVDAQARVLPASFAGATVTVVPARGTADFSHDGLVDFDDFFLFADHFGRTQVDPGWDGRYDLIRNGAVDFDDFFAFADHFGTEARAKLMALAREHLGLPGAARLEPSYPNPFNSSTTIRYQLAQSERVHLDILDVSGQRVRSLASGHMAAGAHTAAWDGLNDQGRPLAAGVYFVRLQTGAETQATKLLLAK